MEYSFLRKIGCVQGRTTNNLDYLQNNKTSRGKIMFVLA